MSKSILIVDDCATTRRLVGLYMKQEGYALVQAENGLEALEKLARSPVDLIITDMNMPQMDGVALTRSLKQDQTLGSIPVLMLTSEDADNERKNGLAAGAAAYLTKPISHDRLVQEVRRLLGSAA
ncbi:MAG: response regulator [Nitrospirae bacterium]|nr:response regulator [Nitrospirota bacterium]